MEAMGVVLTKEHLDATVKLDKISNLLVQLQVLTSAMTPSTIWMLGAIKAHIQSRMKSCRIGNSWIEISRYHYERVGLVPSHFNKDEVDWITVREHLRMSGFAYINRRRHPLAEMGNQHNPGIVCWGSGIAYWEQATRDNANAGTFYSAYEHGNPTSMMASHDWDYSKFRPPFTPRDDFGDGVVYNKKRSAKLRRRT